MNIYEEIDPRLGIPRWCVDAGQVAGKRLRRRFATREEADLWAKEQINQENRGHEDHGALVENDGT